jgi:predicted aldo/keto reductase-like oxidoreductase
MKRRDFLVTGATGAIALHNLPHPLSGAVKKEASDRIILGPRKVSVSRLGMGTGTNGVNGASNQTRKLGVKGVADMYKFGYDNGVTFWDSADQYGSHPHLREALKYVKRENVTILTKTNATTAAGMKSDIDRFRRELNTDYIDILLLHCMVDDDWPEKKKAAMDVITEAQAKGIVHTKGTSCHSLGAFPGCSTGRSRRDEGCGQRRDRYENPGSRRVA